MLSDLIEFFPLSKSPQWTKQLFVAKEVSTKHSFIVVKNECSITSQPTSTIWNEQVMRFCHVKSTVGFSRLKFLEMSRLQKHEIPVRGSYRLWTYCSLVVCYLGIGGRRGQVVAIYLWPRIWRMQLVANSFCIFPLLDGYKGGDTIVKSMLAFGSFVPFGVTILWLSLEP